MAIDDNGSQREYSSGRYTNKTRLEKLEKRLSERLLIRITVRCQGSGAVIK
jgi:hypothetical protein